MNRKEWQTYLQMAPIILDGATGTNLQAAGLPSGVCLESWVLEHPQVLADLQRAFYKAGSDLVYAFTFGANRIKLGHQGIADSEVVRFNRELAAISCAVRDEVAAAEERPTGRPPLVAGDLAPTGEFLAPAGTLAFETLVEIYRQQVTGLLEAGVDLFVTETMLDLSQTRAAVLAVREACDLPIMASLTVEQNGRTLSGNSILECVIALASCGADAVGLNCSFGPDGLGQLARDVLAQSPVPILIKPNAGLPRLVDGKTIFDMTPDPFASAMADLAAAGVQLVGGCCGTTPAHIEALAKALAAGKSAGQSDADLQRTQAQHAAAKASFENTICSGRQTVELDWDQLSDWPVVASDDPEDLPDEVLDAAEDEPGVLVIDLAAVSADLLDDWLDALDLVQMQTDIPLIFNGRQPDILAAVVRRYQGRTAVLASPDSSNAAALRGAIVKFF
jgi:5-methyltetrahydrofolate--homocysteine methyltransferase